MTPIKRPSLPRHTVIVDTNVAWHTDKSNVVAPAFQEFLDRMKERIELDLLLPAVVRSELLFQQTTSATKALRRANESFDLMGAVAGRQYTHRVTEDRVRQDVTKRLDVWVSQNRATIMATPVGTIDWNAMVEKAVWRQPPFTFDDKNPSVEKGFRDALILATVVQHCRTEVDRTVAFICGDYLLRTTAEGELDGDEKVSCYESLAEFESYLGLAEQELTEQFVRAIRSRAKKKFFSPDSDDTLLVRANVLDRVRDQYPDDFATSTVGRIFSKGLFGEPKPTAEWDPTAGDQVWIGNPRFETLEGAHTYIWKSSVRFVRPYTRKDRVLAVFMNEPLKIYIREYDVEWHAKVWADGRFRDMDVRTIERVKGEFRAPTDEETARYGVDTSASS